LARESGEWDWPVCLWPRGDLNFLRQGRLRIPRPCANGMNVLMRRTRLERVDERVTAEGSVRRGLGEKLSAFSEIRLIGDSILRRGLIET
jgi:hypothetical protein